MINNVDTPRPTLVSLCRGIGMLDEAVRLVLPDVKILCSAEWEAYANAVVLARMAEQTIEPHPIWFGDIGGLNLECFHGMVDILVAGLPCQPYSLLGHQKGNEDHRSWGEGNGPLPNTIRIIYECRPSVVFFENVSAWVRSSDQWFRPFGEELCRMGYTLLEPIFITANDVGASHLRERVFVMGYSQGTVLRGGLRKITEVINRFESTLSGSDVVHSQQSGLEGHRGNEPQGNKPRRKRSQSVRPARAASHFIFAPGPESGEWDRIVREETPQLWPKVESGFRVLADGLAMVVDAERIDQLRCSGNGVVPLQAAVVFVEFLRRAGL